MIRILAETRDGRLARLTITGHAGFAAKGQDIYCAGVSAVFQGAVNCLDGPADDYLVQAQSGLGEIQVKGEVGQHDATVLEVLYRELKDLAASYPEYISFKEETR